MGSDDDAPLSGGEGPTVKALVDHITANFTSDGVYPRGSGDDFLQVVLPNRMAGFPAFLAELEQCAGSGSQIVFVATSDETRLDIFLGARYESGNPIGRQKGSSSRSLCYGVLLGIIVSLLLPFLAGMASQLR